MKKNNPRQLNPNEDYGRRKMHFDRSRSRHIQAQTPDYGLRSDRIHTPSSGFGHSDVDSYDADRFMNPNVRYVPNEPNRDLSGQGFESDPRLARKDPYRMSDTDISDLVYDVLARHPEIDVSRIDFEVRRGVVLLHGSVETRRMKRLIEDVIFGLPNIQDVQNRIEVPRHDPDRRRMARSLS